MSALPPKADIDPQSVNVRFGHRGLFDRGVGGRLSMREMGQAANGFLIEINVAHADTLTPAPVVTDF